MRPASFAQCVVRRGDVQPFRTQHQPVEPHKFQPLVDDRPAQFPTLRRRNRLRLIGQGERRNLDSGIADLADLLTGGIERVLRGHARWMKNLVAKGMTEWISHVLLIT